MKTVASVKGKLHISTIDPSARGLALRFGTGIESAHFCWAQYMDLELDKHFEKARADMSGISSLWFHAPFAELSPSAIDPRVLALTRERYLSSIRIAGELGIKRIVIHSGYIPKVYFPEYFVERSIEFWKELMKGLPGDILIALENVMDETPDMLVQIAREADDKRLGLCLDIGHANCSNGGVSPIGWLEAMREYLVHVHIHNNFGERDTHNALPEGSIPMEETLLAISELCPEATLTIENMNSLPSLEWLCEKGFL